MNAKWTFGYYKDSAYKVKNGTVKLMFIMMPVMKFTNSTENFKRQLRKTTKTSIWEKAFTASASSWYLRFTQKNTTLACHTSDVYFEITDYKDFEVF